MLIILVLSATTTTAIITVKKTVSLMTISNLNIVCMTIFVCIYVCTYVSMHACVYLCMSACIYRCIVACIYYAYMSVCLHVHMYVLCLQVTAHLRYLAQLYRISGQALSTTSNSRGNRAKLQYSRIRRSRSLQPQRYRIRLRLSSGETVAHRQIHEGNSSNMSAIRSTGPCSKNDVL